MGEKQPGSDALSNDGRKWHTGHTAALWALLSWPVTFLLLHLLIGQGAWPAFAEGQGFWLLVALGVAPALGSLALGILAIRGWDRKAGYWPVVEGVLAIVSGLALGLVALLWTVLVNVMAHGG